MDQEGNKMLTQEQHNILEMIGCNKEEFQEIVNFSTGKINMLSSSYYGKFFLYDTIGLLAKYESNGNLIYKR